MNAAVSRDAKFAPRGSRALAFAAALALHGLAVFAFLRPAATPPVSEQAIEVTVEPENAAVAPAAPGPWPVASPLPASPAASSPPEPLRPPEPAPVETPSPPEPQPAPPEPSPTYGSPVAPPRPAQTASAARTLAAPPSKAERSPAPAASPRPAARPKRTPATEAGPRPAPAGEEAPHRRSVAARDQAPSLSGAAYGALVSAEIARHKFYPPAARAAGFSGNVGVSVTVGADGRIAAHAITRSSGHPELDGAVGEILAAVQVPPPPGGRFRASLTLHFAIE